MGKAPTGVAGGKGPVDVVVLADDTAAAAGRALAETSARTEDDAPDGCPALPDDEPSDDAAPEDPAPPDDPELPDVPELPDDVPDDEPPPDDPDVADGEPGGDPPSVPTTPANWAGSEDHWAFCWAAR